MDINVGSSNKSKVVVQNRYTCKKTIEHVEEIEQKSSPKESSCDNESQASDDRDTESGCNSDEQTGFAPQAAPPNRNTLFNPNKYYVPAAVNSTAAASAYMNKYPRKKYSGIQWNNYFTTTPPSYYSLVCI